MKITMSFVSLMFFYPQMCFKTTILNLNQEILRDLPLNNMEIALSLSRVTFLSDRCESRRNPSSVHELNREINRLLRWPFKDLDVQNPLTAGLNPRRPTVTAPPLNPDHIQQDKNTREFGVLKVRLNQLEGVTIIPSLKEDPKRALVSKQAEGQAATAEEQNRQTSGHIYEQKPLKIRQETAQTQRQRLGLKDTACRWRQSGLWQLITREGIKGRKT